jgi:transcription antitermination protein NusB
MQARRIARELALLSLSQLPANPAKLDQKGLQDVLLAAVRTLTTEVRDTIETASAELQRSNALILDSETRTSTPEQAKTILQEAIVLTQTAINRLGASLDLPEFVQLANQSEVRDYALEIVRRYYQDRDKIQQQLDNALVDCQLSRLAAVDRHILQIATVEIVYLGVPDRVAINEAVELAKRYSEEDGHRFINGVLRKVVQQINRPDAPTIDNDHLPD